MLVSPRMGVERRLLSDFCNGANRAKVLERCQKMNDLFDRPCIVLESDKPTEDGVFPRSIHIQGNCGSLFHSVISSDNNNCTILGTHRSKYVDTLFSQLSESKIRLFFSEDQAQTAKIIAALTKRECSKGQEFPRPIKLTEFQEKVMMPFYQVGTISIICISHSKLYLLWIFF